MEEQSGLNYIHTIVYIKLWRVLSHPTFLRSISQYLHGFLIRWHCLRQRGTSTLLLKVALTQNGTKPAVGIKYSEIRWLYPGLKHNLIFRPPPTLVHMYIKEASGLRQLSSLQQRDQYGLQGLMGPKVAESSGFIQRQVMLNRSRTLPHSN